MQRQFLFATVAVAALSLGAAVAQTGGTGGSGGAGGTGGSTTTSPGSGGASGGGATQPVPRSGTTGSDKSTGQAPGLEQRGSPPPGVGQGSDRAQERRTGEQPGAQGTPDRTSPGQTNGQRSGGSDTRSGASGGSSAGGEVNVTSEQQTRIRSVVSKVNIREVSNVNVNIAVGTVLPSTVELVAVPPELIEIVPQFRSYRVIKVSGRILIVEPSSRRIVYIINA